MPELSAEQALVLSGRRFGEKSWIITLFTKDYGRVSGIYRHKKSPEIGTLVKARWQARLSEQLGTIYLEETRPLAVNYLDDSKRLACLSSVCALLNDVLPERQNFAELYVTAISFLQQLDRADFLKNYVLFEKQVLSDIGFGLDLSGCAGGGDSNDLAYVSPKTGRAVSREKGKPYHDKLLILPGFFWRDVEASAADIQAGLLLTGYFLTLHAPRHRLPRVRYQIS